MPRSGRGGKRQGTPGTTYRQRKDLNDTQPIEVPNDLGYGERTAAENAQRIAPMAGNSTGPTPAPQAPMPMSGPPLVPLTAPTQRPDHQLSDTPGTFTAPESDLGRLADYLPILEILASRPGTSQATRNFVRTVRSNMPTGLT